MKKLNKKICLVVSAAMIGAMSCMTGCSSSGGAETQVENRQVETQQIETRQTETQQIETETVQSTQEESSESQPESTSEEVQTETETQSEAESKAEVETKAEEKPEQAESVQAEAPVAEGSVAASDFAMVVRGVTVPLGSDLRDYTALLGEPDEYGAAKSCVEAGDDKVYTYGGVVIYTYITNGADIVSLIEITGSESLPSGIHIGSTKADVIAAYGSSYTEEGTELLYEMGNKTIGLQMSGETVSFMELFGQ